MGFFSKFEGKVEDTFEGAANKMFDAPISPVQIAKKAEKQMRREKMVGAGKQYAPTLYTVLVNPNDDERLFGYYPTLAGETETYLSAKAVQDGLVMDGQPLVRFIVDEGLRKGKFEVIAEPVAAPIIAQLRAEEMHRYGLAEAPAPRPAQNRASAGSAYPAPANAQADFNQDPSFEASGGPGYQDINFNTSNQDGAAHGDASYAGEPYGGAPYDEAAYQDAPYSDSGYQDANMNAGEDNKPPLPYVPEEEIDYSLDYGEYTFNSQDFDDYRQNGATVGDSPHGAPHLVGGPHGAPQGGAPQGTPHGAPLATPDTIVFAAGAGNANPTPNKSIVRARLIDSAENRTYDLAAAHLVLGRDTKNSIVVNDINASRKHAELRFEPQGVWSITDLGSTNGTLVNGREITSQPLTNGDRITIGMTNYVFTLV